MNPHAACLSALNAAWQSPRVANDPAGSGAVDASDSAGPPSEKTPLPTRTRSPAPAPKLLSERAEQIVKLLGLFSLAVATALAPYLIYNGRIGALESSVSSLAQTVAGNDKHLTDVIAANDKRLDEKLNIIGNWLKDPTKFPGGARATPVSSSVTPDPSGTPLAPNGVPVNAMPITAKPVLLQSCVDRNTRHVEQCNPATMDCYGKESFNPEFFRKLRTDSGAGDWMVVCDPKKSP